LTTTQRELVKTAVLLAADAHLAGQFLIFFSRLDALDATEKATVALHEAIHDCHARFALLTFGKAIALVLETLQHLGFFFAIWFRLWFGLFSSAQAFLILAATDHQLE
jgi:hypothetical protein